MKFHLTIHNPYRPVEGLLIDLKTRYPHFDAEILRPHVEDFLDKVLLTDIPLQYAPSQVSQDLISNLIISPSPPSEILVNLMIIICMQKFYVRLH